MKKIFLLVIFSLFSTYFILSQILYVGFSLEAPVKSDTLSYSDDFINIQFQIYEDKIVFDIQNKTNSIIKINWDEISFVSINGQAFRVVHSGVLYINPNAPQTPTIIPPDSKLHDILIPSENIYFDSSNFEWKLKPLFPFSSQIMHNKSFSIYFPLEIKGKRKDYTFKFKYQIPKQNYFF